MELQYSRSIYWLLAFWHCGPVGSSHYTPIELHKLTKHDQIVGIKRRLLHIAVEFWQWRGTSVVISEWCHCVFYVFTMQDYEYTANLRWFYLDVTMMFNKHRHLLHFGQSQCYLHANRDARSVTTLHLDIVSIVTLHSVVAMSVCTLVLCIWRS